MQEEFRLINDFKLQSANGIWKFLDAIAMNYAVYSTHLKGLPPYLTEYDVYLYCNDTDMVIMCLECCEKGKDRTYMESESLGSLIFIEGSEPRISTVGKLAEAVRHAKESLQDYDYNVNVYGILLTETIIENEIDLWKMWDKKHNVWVIDYLTRLKRKTIKVNRDDSLKCKDYVDVVVNGKSSVKKANKPEASDRESEGVYKAVVEEYCKKLSDEKLSDEDEYFFGSKIYPDGKIEQNKDVSVKVEILRPIPNPREELEKLVGCTDIKRRMDELVALTSYNEMMYELFPGKKRHEISLHSIFLGCPGTGKTTVCKIFGSLLHKAGALSKGHVVVCDRSTFIGTLWGDEERSVRQVLEMAKGGVLMIDEAYLLNGEGKDPGKLVIPLLMNILADESRRDIAVVLCGYKEPMMKLLDINPGLQSRFPNKFEFMDFTIDELMEITRRRIKEYNYLFTLSAWEKYRSIVEQAYQMRDPETWGNARFIANQLERIYIQHAIRCMKQPPAKKDELLVITPEDIVPIEVPRPKAKIGF